MEHSELFLLLPRYEEVEGQPEYIRTKGVMTENEILKVIENINEICRFIANENYEGYYDADNVSSFLYPVETQTPVASLWLSARYANARYRDGYQASRNDILRVGEEKVVLFVGPFIVFPPISFI